SSPDVHRPLRHHVRESLRSPANIGPHSIGRNDINPMFSAIPYWSPVAITATRVGWMAVITCRRCLRALTRVEVEVDLSPLWRPHSVPGATYIATIKLTVALLYRALAGAWPRFGDVSWYVMLAATLGSTVVGGQVAEELGWRGYALPRLAMRFGLGGASVLLGVLWAGWHLPLFFILGGDTVGQSFPLYVVQVTALSVAIAWLYLKTQGSLLLTMLLHAAVNNTKDIVPSAVPGATQPWALSTSLVA